MRIVKRILTAVAAAVAVAGFCLSPSCGGGDDTVQGGLTATFGPFPGEPPPSVAMQPRAASGDTFSVGIAVQGVSNFFGAAFHVTYDYHSATFLSMDSSGSFLRGAGITADSFQAIPVSQGDLQVIATRFQNASGTVPGVSGNGDLVVLTFRATQRTGGNSFLFESPREVQVCTAATGCRPLTVGWSGGLLRAS